MKKLSLFLLIIGASPLFAANFGDPSAVNIKVYDTWISPNADCSNATHIFHDSSPSYQNFAAGPTLGSASVPNGTYQCIVIKMSDVITGTPNYTSTSLNCTPSTSIQNDVFRAGSNSTCPDSTAATGSGTDSSPVDDSPCLYMSTSGNSSNEGWLPNSPFPLTAAFVVSATTTGTFVADFTGQIVDDGSSCGIEPPVFGFR